MEAPDQGATAPEKKPSKQQLRKAEKAAQQKANASAKPKQPQGQSPKVDKQLSKDGSQTSRDGSQTSKTGSQPSKDSSQASAGDASLPSKSDLKKQRRDQQEAARAAKAKAKEEKTIATTQKKENAVRVPDAVKADVPATQRRVNKKLEKQQIPKRTSAQRKVRLFNHLQQYEREVSLTQSLQFSNGGIHPAVIRLGLQYAEGVITGSNARCLALLAALKMVVADYSTPPKQELCRDLAIKIKPYISYLNQCRPLSVSMGNAIKYVKWHIAHTPADMSDSEAKEQLKACIDDFRERIDRDAKAISTEASVKISAGDVILVYSCSSLIRRVLCDAHREGKQFRVIVADSRPKMEGREMLRRLVKDGIKCSYVLINAVSYVITEATKVFLGAHGLLANGFVMSRVGTALIALMAKAHNVPVLVCCETYKFCERVQTDSFVFNELGDPDDLVDIGKKTPYLWDWRDYDKLTLLNLMYDFTPPEFVTMVITELGMIPCTSVPVVLRMKQAETIDT